MKRLYWYIISIALIILAYRAAGARIIIPMADFAFCMIPGIVGLVVILYGYRVTRNEKTIL